MAFKNAVERLVCLVLFSAISLSAQSSSATIVPASSSFGRVPLYFEENRGQTDARARYIARGATQVAFITQDGFAVSLNGQAVAMRIVDAEPSARMMAEGVVEGVSNYYLGKRSISGLQHYFGVRVSGIRPDIDIVYHGNQQNLEYDLVIRPGAAPNALRFRFEGGPQPEIDENGDLVLKTASGELRQRAPAVWQEAGSVRRKVACKYVLSGPKEVRLDLSRYDRAKELLIDPIISYSTFLSGTSTDIPGGIAADSSGFAYLTGETCSVDFPATTGTFHGTCDVFVTKLNASGTGLLYSTFIGGSSQNQGNAIGIDTSGNAYVAGSTSSNDFPFTNHSYGGQSDAFVLEVDPTGSLMYATALGGSNTDTGTAIAVDTSGAAYVAGTTSSSDFPVTPGALKTTHLFTSNGFVVKVSAAGQILYATYLGGSNSDAASAIAVDSTGNAYVGGTSNSHDFPATMNAYSKVLNGSEDAFIAKLNPAGAALVYATLLGGSSTESLVGLAIDIAGECYIAGSTFSTDFPTTPGAFSNSNPNDRNQGEGYVTKLNTTGTALVFSTFLSYDSNQTVKMAVDSNGSTYVAGDVIDSFSTTPGALRIAPSTPSYEYDIFLIKLSSDGTAITYSTLLGSANSNTSAYGLTLDGDGGVYVMGQTNSDAYPTTLGAFQALNPKGADNRQYSVIITKIDFSSPTVCNPIVSPASQSMPGHGGPISFSLTLAAGCPWEAFSENSFITMNAPTHGIVATSPIELSGTVGLNDSTNANGRTGVVIIGAATFTVNQAAGSCQDPLITPGSISYTSSGGTQNLNLDLPSSCTWTAVSNTPWLTVTSGGSGTGPATISILAAQNSFSQRSATLTIAGTAIRVTQSGLACTATAAVTPDSFAGPGSTGAVSISTSSSNCGWWAYSTAPWIQLVPQSSRGQGSGLAAFVVLPNPGIVARIGYILIADQTVTVNQSAGPAGSTNTYVSSVYAGGGPDVAGFGAGGPATNAYLSGPGGLAFDRATGNLYIAVPNLFRIFVVTPDGNIGTIAGAPGYAQRLAVDASSSVYFNELVGVGKITNGIVSSVAGTNTAGFSGDNGPATSAQLINPLGVAMDSLGNLYIADTGNNRIRKVSGGTITTFAGGGSSGLGDNGPATSAALNYPEAVAVDNAQNIYIADSNQGLVRKVSHGTISTLASVPIPLDLAVDLQGNVLVIANGALEKISPTGAVSVISDAGAGYFSGGGVAIDAMGNVYFSDFLGGVVRKFTPAISPCTYSLDTLPSGVIAGAGATVTISVTAANGCSWTAYSGAAAATVLSGSSGSGNGSVSINFAANTTGAPRTVALAIAGQVINLTQPVAPPQLGFFPLTPCRVADTRSGSGDFGAPYLTGGLTRSFPMPSSACNIPSGAEAYSLNITIVPHGPLPYLTAWPTGVVQPVVSTLNSLSGAIVANAAIVPAGTNGAISLFAYSDTDVIVDINGYFAPPTGQALAFYPVTPCRVADTRNAVGIFGGPEMSAQQGRTFPVPSSSCGIATSAQAYSLNMTVVPSGSLPYLTTWPAGQIQPLVSTLNDVSGDIVANAAIVPAGTDGGLDVFVYSASNVIIDINGYFAPPASGALYFYPVTPCRAVDTRVGSGFTGLFGAPSLVGQAARSFPIPTSNCGVPGTAQAYSTNMTLVPPAPMAYLSVWPTGQTQPVVSTLNDLTGAIVANAAIVPAGTSGAISAFAYSATDLLIDITGYFAP